MKKLPYIIIAIIIVILIVIDASFLCAGSLESYPTEEQLEKGRIGYGLILIILSFIELLVVKRIFKKK